MGARVKLSVAQRLAKKGKPCGNNMGQGDQTNGKEGEENAEEKTWGDEDSAGEEDTKGSGKAEVMDGPSKDIGKKGQQKAKLYNERTVMQGKRY